MKIRFGVCTYNRKELIEYTSKSLNLIEGIRDCSICIYDDCSDEYNETYLKYLYKNATKISINKENMGADVCTRNMYIDFLKSEDEWLFNADSDLIFDSEILLHIEETINYLKNNKINAIVSFFNTPSHIKINDYSDKYIEKNHVGAAGILLDRRAAGLIVRRVKEGSCFDWRFCKEWKKAGNIILCTKKSYVQHIGVWGHNSKFDNFDWGINFSVSNLVNAQAIEDVMEIVFTQRCVPREVDNNV